jgi:hypothetical protein
MKPAHNDQESTMERTNPHGKCAHTACNCSAGHEGRFCSDYCEDHASRPIEDSEPAGASGGCGCGHSECIGSTSVAAD